MASTIIGLDIGSSAIRGVEIRRNGKSKPNLLRYHSVPLPEGAVNRGEVVEPQAVTAALKRLWSEGKFKSKNVVLGTGNQRTLVRDLSIPKASMKRIRESLPFHVQNTLQMPMDGSLFDFYPISESVGDHGLLINGLLVTTEKGAILGNINVAERAGLMPTEVELIPFALNRILMSRSQASGTVALVDVGSNTTTVVIAQDGIPLFVRIIPSGGDDLTSALQVSLEIVKEEAEELKRLLHLNPDWKNSGDLTGYTSNCSCSKCTSEITLADDPRTLEILRSISNELLGSVRDTINYFNNAHSEKIVNRILLVGGGSQLSGFAESLSEMVVLPVSRPDPFSGVTLSRKAKANREKKCGTFSVALGLAMRNL
jgi:type IV pilus assembly protein PilM